MFNKKLEKETKVANLHTEDIINQLIKYNIFDKFTSREELEEWISKLNSFKINNILSLKIELEDIKFDSKLLINNNLLNTIDYIKKVEALVSINNADGYYQLFDRMLHPEFLNSQKFYQDIETSLNNIDISSCNINNIKIDLKSIKGVIVSEIQAIVLSQLLGIKIKE